MVERVEHLAEGVSLYLGDCRDILPSVRAGVVVTSPPYDKQRDYGAKIADWRSVVAAPLSSIVDAGHTQVLVNLGMVHSDGEVVEYWRPLLADMKAAGWRHFGWYVWDQGPGLSGRFGGRFAPAHEFVLHFNKTAREPNKCVPCLHSGLRKTRGAKSNMRKPSGEAAAYTGTETTVQPFKIPDTVIRVMRQRYSGGAIETGHPAVFPVDFATALVEPYSNAGEVVCDPYMGSGTTGVSCVRSGRKFIGIEIEPKYFDIACRRIDAELRKPGFLIQKPKRIMLTPV
jgi:DNA modification methylase